MCGWAAVAAVSFTALLVQYRRYSRRILGKLSPAPEPVQEMFSRQMKVLNICREVRLKVSSDVHTPAVFGFWRPVILLPEGEHERFSREELSNVLAHELAHIKRRDMLFTFVVGLLSCLYWFHPAVWLANLNLRREREMACDDVVLESTRQEAKQYARTILHVAESFDGGVPAGAGFLGLLELSDNLLHRIRSVADTRRARRFGWSSAVAILLLTVACVPMGRWSERAAVPGHPNTANVDDEIKLHYSKADPEVQEYVRWTAATFGRPGVNLWLPENAFDSLTAEERNAKVDYCTQVLEGEYGRHLCRAVVEAGVLRDKRLLPGVLRVATYHREDSDYDCRPKWMAVAALGRFGDESVVPELVNLVDHGNKNTRMWARASLVRLTGRNFNRYKQAWARWWNEAGKKPRIDPAALKPWRPAASGVQGATERKPSSFADVQTEYFDASREAKKVSQSAPEIVSVSPPIGASEVDPGTKEIRVTFDQDMRGGFSWTGGGPVFPKGTGRPQWVDKRTCVMPVALEPAKFYRVGINSKSHNNFRGVNGVPARVRVIYFATEGADESVLRALKAPTVVSMTPENGATDVPSTLTEMSVTFDQPMVGGFSWTGGGDQFPEGTGRPQWSADKMTCSRLIKLKPNWSYRLGLNSPSHINFQSANGVPLEPVVWRFSTGD
jgi:hypothetical protein